MRKFIFQLAVFVLFSLTFFIGKESVLASENLIDGKYAPLINDALIEKAEDKKDVGGPESGIGKAAYNAGFYETSEFMQGSISITLILPESNGAFDPNTYDWSLARENSVLNEVKTGMNWWKNNNPKANLSFKYHLISGRTDSRAKTVYEPILRTSGATNGGRDGEALWVNEIAAKLGYSGSTSHLTNSRGFLNEQIAKDGADFGVLIFVVNSGTTASTSKFSDGMFAYSYYGGPFLVMTYNNYNYGISNMDAVAAHELGHSFYALDQYYSARQDCAARLGYLDVPNQNSEFSNFGGGCLTDNPSIMRGGVTPFLNNQIDYYAKGQIGLWDTDTDGINDVVDTKPKIEINSKTGSRTVVVKGTAEVTPLENKNSYFQTLHFGIPRRNVSTDEIAQIQYRIDQGTWSSLLPDDGKFDNGTESFSITTPNLSEGDHSIEIKTRNSVGNWSNTTGVYTKTTTKQIITGAGETGGPHLRFFDRDGVLINHGFFAYPDYWRTGVRVAAGDLTGDGKDEVITAPGPGGVPQIKVFNNDGTLKSSFFAYSDQYSGGVYIAAGDVDNDGKKEIITGTGIGGGPQIRVFDVSGNPVFTPGFFAFARTFRGGVFVAAGDINGDGKEEILAGAGKGGGPQVMAFTRYGVNILNFFPYDSNIRTGVEVASGDVNGDGKIEIITGPGTGGGPHVRVFNGVGQAIAPGFFAYAEHVRSGVQIAAADLNNDDKAEIITGAGPGGGPHVRIFDYLGNVINAGFFAYDKNFRGGVNVAVGDFN